MWKSLMVALLFATPALAEEQATAYEALRVVGTQFGRGALNHVVSITGVEAIRSRRSGKSCWKIRVRAVVSMKSKSLMDTLPPNTHRRAQSPVLLKEQRST